MIDPISWRVFEGVVVCIGWVVLACVLAALVLTAGATLAYWITVLF